MEETLTVKNKTVSQAKTGWSWWQLQSENGRQTWSYTGPEFSEEARLQLEKDFLFLKAENPNAADKILRLRKLNAYQVPEIPVGLSPEEESCFRAVDFYRYLQEDDGHWAGDYGGPMFLLPGLVITSYITETPLSGPQQTLIRQYLLNQQNEDGGWGIHIEDKSTMFGTVLQYISLRILGMDAQEPAVTKARNWIHAHGGATGIPSWGKFYLAVLGAYHWDGMNTLAPELWLLPRSLPIHPGRYWCHARMVYLPMSFMYGKRFTGKITPLVSELRKELYLQPYESISWKRARFKVCKEDIYTRPSPLLKILYRGLNIYEAFALKKWRKKAVDFAFTYIETEDRHTNYINIGPVNKVINSLSVYFMKGKDSPEFQQHVERWKDYLWVAEDGMKMNGYNGSQLWDTAFAVKAILESGMGKYFPETLKNGYRFIAAQQVKEEVENHRWFFRHDSVGGWPFSTADHGWPITDCSADGASAVYKMHQSTFLTTEETLVREEDLRKNVDLLLSFQNKNGGWASYELQRGPSWVEKLNPSEVFGDIMVDFPYVECSSACIQSLASSLKVLHYKEEDVQASIKKGADFIKGIQRPDGSWIGSWAVCFTYGTWFGIEGLLAAGEKGYATGQVSPHIHRACEFLASKQKVDGGWGESFYSCVQKQYIQHEKSQVVNTAWALLSLMAAGYPDHSVIERGIRLLRERQETTGDWPQEAISGVFNFNCMITYTSYRNVFPIWALGRYINQEKMRRG